MLELDPQYFFAVSARYRREYVHGRIDNARRELAQAYAVNPDVAAAEWGLFRWSQGEASIADAFVQQLITAATAGTTRNTPPCAATPTFNSRVSVRRATSTSASTSTTTSKGGRGTLLHRSACEATPARGRL